MRLKQVLASFYFFIFCGILMAQGTYVLDVLKPLNHALRSSSPETIAYYTLDERALSESYESGLPEELAWQMLLDEKLVTLHLQKTNLFSPQFSVLNSQGQRQDSDLGQHYQYNRRDTMVTVSIYKDQLSGFFIFKNQNLTLARQANQVKEYVLTTADPISPVACHTSNQIESQLIRKMQQLPDKKVATRNQLPPVDVYFELDHYLYLEQESSISKSIAFLTGIFNSVQLLYAREGITVRIHSVKVWEYRDGFETQNASAALNSFRNYIEGSETIPEWDIAVLVSRYNNEVSSAPNGGLANLDGLCNSAKRQLYTNISATSEAFPDFSWPVFLISHEIGHTLGAAHSHNCNWPEGPLDNCYCPEGDCETGPAVDATGGTIMSYCYLANAFNSSCPELPNGTNPGVNFFMGFGKYPGDLIRQNIAEAYCLKDKQLDSLPNLQADTAATLWRVNDSLVITGLKISNNGIADIDSFQLALSNDLKDTIVYQEVLIQLAGLPAGDTLVLDTVLYLPEDGQVLNWTWTLDPSQMILEWHEGDNITAQKLQQNLQFPQLQIPASGTITDSTYFFTLRELQIANIGGYTAEDIHIQYFLSLDLYWDVQDLSIGTNRVNDLSKASTAMVNLAVFKPNLLIPAGEYYLIGKVKVAETNIPPDYTTCWIFVLDHKIKLSPPRFGWYRN